MVGKSVAFSGAGIHKPNIRERLSLRSIVSLRNDGRQRYRPARHRHRSDRHRTGPQCTRAGRAHHGRNDVLAPTRRSLRETQRRPPVTGVLAPLGLREPVQIVSADAKPMIQSLTVVPSKAAAPSGRARGDRHLDNDAADPPHRPPRRTAVRPGTGGPMQGACTITTPTQLLSEPRDGCVPEQPFVLGGGGGPKDSGASA